MRERGSIFLKIRILTALLAVLLSTTGCGPRKVWGYPADELALRLSTGRYAILASVDFSTQDPSQALSLSPGAPYYLALVFDSMDMTDQSLRMLELAWARCPDPWKREAGVLLGQKYNARKSWPQAIQVATRILSTQQPPDMEQRARHVLVEALYWMQQDQEMLHQADLLTGPDPEVLLFRGVSSLRLGLASAHDLIVQLFLRERVSALHARFFTFLAGASQYAEGFTDLEKDLISAKNDLFLGDWDAGIPLMESVLAGLESARSAGSALVADLASAYQSSGRQAAGARFLAGVSARLTGRARADALEQAGKIYRRLRLYPQAFSTLRSAIAASVDADQRDRERWYLVDMIISQKPPDVLAQVDRELSASNDPGFFSDVLDDWTSDLVGAGKWKTLIGLWRIVQTRGPRGVEARLAYLLGRAGQEGLITPVGALPATPRDFLREAVTQDPDGYYGLMASCILGDMPEQVKPRPQDAEPQNKPALDPFITGFIPFGLFSQAYQKIVESRRGLSDAELREAARLMAQAGDYASSMHLMGILARRRSLSQQELEMEYPRAFSSVIDELSTTSGIRDSVLYGLVREESYFDPDIVSSVGAVGLSQLMPATATAVARRLHMAEPDLRDPSVNLAIGVRHFQDLLSSVNSVPKALLSYNAGLTRVRAWEKAGGDMPGDLFVESVPFEETRKYVRKILISTVMYAFLYGNEDPRDAVLAFFGIAPRN
ncbi:MAG: lytic transglycosylase domain-containing protein [Spirochaetia bacterium]